MIERFSPFPSICQKAAVTQALGFLLTFSLSSTSVCGQKMLISIFFNLRRAEKPPKGREKMRRSVPASHLNTWSCLWFRVVVFYFIIFSVLCLSLLWFCSLPPVSPLSLLPLFFLLLHFIFIFIFFSVFIFMKNLYLHSSGRGGNPQRVLFLCCRWRWPGELAFDGRVDTLCYLETLRMTPESLVRLSGRGHLVRKRRAPGPRVHLLQMVQPSRLLISLSFPFF